MLRRSIIFLLFVFVALPLVGQTSSEPQDSLVRLLSAKVARNIENDTELIRKIEGPARFLHNDTYLICDTAYWYVDRDYMDAIGNVQVIQENTLLTGDKLHYIINQDLAQFRGVLVELTDKEGNILRTNNLDYNTKDSIGTYFSGAAMMDKDSSFIESDKGIYESKKSMFTFIDNVEMYSDTSYFISDTLKYFSDLDVVHFATETKGWQQKNFISSDGGIYDKGREVVVFHTNVYARTEGEEVWCDSLVYDRHRERAELYQNIQLFGEKDDAYAFGDSLIYESSPMKFGELWKDPVIISVTEEVLEGGGVKQDTVFVSSDLFRFYEKQMCDIDSAEVARAAERKKLLQADPMANIRKNQREAAEKENEKNAIKKPGPRGVENEEEVASEEGAVADSVAVVDTVVAVDSVALVDTVVVVDSLTIVDLGTVDSLAVVPVADSLGLVLVADSVGVSPVDSLVTVVLTDSLGTVVSDSLATVKDTTLVKFVDAIRNVKIFKEGMQVACDSLVYTGLDSIARLYERPIMWNQIKTQLTSDSMQVFIKNGNLSKGNLLSNAFMATLEDSIYYHQVKSPELIGYFDEGKLSRFDAIGGFTAKFFIAEKKVVSTQNHKEGKIMSATLKNEEIQRIHYLENIKSDTFPLFSLKNEELYIKGFEWRAEERPVDRFSLTNRRLRPSERATSYKPYFPTFSVSKTYFDFFPTDVVDVSQSQAQ